MVTSNGSANLRALLQLGAQALGGPAGVLRVERETGFPIARRPRRAAGRAHGAR